MPMGVNTPGPDTPGNVDSPAGTDGRSLPTQAQLAALLHTLGAVLERHLGRAARILRVLAIVGFAAATAVVVVVLVGWPPQTLLHGGALLLLAAVLFQPAFTLRAVAQRLLAVAATPWTSAQFTSAAGDGVDRVTALVRRTEGKRLGPRAALGVVRDLQEIRGDVLRDVPGMEHLVALSQPSTATRLAIALVGVPVLMIAVPVLAVAALLS